MFIGYYNKSIILTFIGLLFTIIGIKYSIDANYFVASICLLLSGICDTFDGTVASLVKRNEKEKEYGVQLDSLVDVICFGIYPIIISMNLGYNSLINIIIYFIFIFCGVTRLAYFNVDSENKKYFKGLPITMSSFIIPIALFISSNEIFLMSIFLITSILYIIKFKIPKSDLKLKFLYLFISIIIILLILSKFLLQN
jgi:CDP-diacylglycerol--serine O-phosphatidyltransferase